VKVSLCLINALRHEGVWVSIGMYSPFLTPSLHRVDWSASRPVRFTPGERAPGAHWIGDLVGSRAGLDEVGRRTRSSGKN
jgi:hypothetical protein